MFSILKQNSITLEQAIDRTISNSSKGVKKQLIACFGKMPDWRDLTKINLYKYREFLLSNVCQSTAHSYCALLKSIIGKWDESGIVKEYRKAMTIPNERPTKIFLTTNELIRFGNVIPKNDTERLVQAQFLLGAYTGCRLSDIQQLSSENVSRLGYIEYTSKKTSTTARVPASAKIIRYIQICEQLKDSQCTVPTFNSTIKVLAFRARIIERVKVFRAGKQEVGEKWKFVTSHTARISFATNLSLCKMPLLDIMRLMGHSNPQMTASYCVNDTVELSDAARKYFE